MIEMYAECSRCRESIPGSIGNSEEPSFEAVQFRQLLASGHSYGLIEREDVEDQNAFRKDYPLCPDCMRDVLEFIKGEFDPMREGDE